MRETTHRSGSVSLVTRIFLFLYGALWLVVLPLLFLSRRLRQGYSQRILPQPLDAPVDIWIQGASGGEAYLALEIISRLEESSSLKILATSCTSQGLSVLESYQGNSSIDLTTTYFPFDLSWIMKRALRVWKPKLVVLLETELWPGLLSEARKKGTEIMVINGRMSAGSFPGYRFLSRVLDDLAPGRIIAASPAYQERFSHIFTRSRVDLMANIKFDRFLEVQDRSSANPLAPFIPDNPFIVLGSVRKEEEALLPEVVKGLLAKIPDGVIGLFPRHMHRVRSWSSILDRIDLKWSLRSTLTGPAAEGSVILWDVFGELNQAYGLARAVFVGGTLAPCGGQNFLEPLSYGVIPCIGPHWDNFDWVGRSIIEQGLVREVDNPDELVHCLVLQARQQISADTVKRQAQEYISERSGGGAQASRSILEELIKPGNPQ